MGLVRNTHERVIPASAEALGELMSTLGSDDDKLWPSPAWLAMRLDRPISVGADGGHGPIRYWVSEYEPGRRVRFTFHPETGIDGFHELVIEPLPDGNVVLRHFAEGAPRGVTRILWPVAIRPMHDAVVEDLLDNAERHTTGGVERPATWSRWVRILRRFTELPRPVAVSVPVQAELARDAFPRIDFSDAWSVPLLPGAPSDPQVWADAIFRDPPRWVGALLLARNALVGLVGIEKGDGHSFDTVGRRPCEVLLGTDAGHLDFRASVLVDDDAVTLSTVVRIHNRRGRLYMAVVSRAHPRIVRAMLHRALRRLAEGRTPRGAARGAASPR
ncbi:DUF2867 domain-containing protein [Phytoactinopolyspora alkaliphila]|uniref:DUF2867 domain-containing protein n=1 Tax=Phytoactinopolyspora alkaliphila TaxID=1783498 RepID=A0A6N9YKY1_9ACTN|nr:DUF2867 domain-containing protein [Phytoactinopolyspora alkaliphila]NED95580.1 DUF2867 domain-containing protein [Phytoactinopolyspora alkaliphila]